MQTVLIKRSSTAGKVPDALQAGELAVNLIDQKLFTADVDGNVFELGGTKVDSGGDPPATGENTGDLYWNGTNLLVWDGAAWEIVGPVVSVNGKDGTVVLDADDVGAATALQGATADSALQPGDDISELNNDAGYITAADVPDESLWKEDGDAVTPKAADADLKIEGSITAAGAINVGGDTSSTTTHGIFAFNNSSTNTHAAVYARNMQAGGQVWAGLNSVGNQTSSINEDGSAKFSGPVETYRVGKSPGVIYFPSDPAIPAGLSVLSSYIYNGSSGSTDGTYFASTPFASASDLTALMANDGSFRLGGTLPSAPNITLAADGSATFANVNGGYSIMTMPAGGDAANWGCFNGALADGTQTSTIRADGSAKFADGNITLAADGSATFAGQVEVKEAGTTNRTIIAGRTLFGYSGPDNADQKYTIDAQTGNAIFAGTVTAGSFDLEALPSLPA